MQELNPPSQHEVMIQEARQNAKKPSYEQLEQKLNILAKKNKNRRMSLNQLGEAHCKTLRLLDIAQFEWKQYQDAYHTLLKELQSKETNEYNGKPWWKLW